jgi:hypothetical protein
MVRQWSSVVFVLLVECRVTYTVYLTLRNLYSCGSWNDDCGKLFLIHRGLCGGGTRTFE